MVARANASDAGGDERSLWRRLRRPENSRGPGEPGPYKGKRKAA